MIKELRQTLETTELEVFHWKNLHKHVVNESEVKSTAWQIKNDELEARYLDLKDRLARSEAELERVSEEHKEYENIVRRNGGKTISEVEQAVDELKRRCLDCHRRYGPNSWEYDEQVEKLKRVSSLYKVITKRHPELNQFFPSESGPSTSSSSSRPSSSRVVVRAALSVDEQERRRVLQARGRSRSSLFSRSRVRGSFSSRSRGGSAPRGRGRDRVSIDDILNAAPGEDFVAKWLSFGSHDGPSL